MASKNTIKLAKSILDRFFRDAEGKTNRQVDVYYTMQDMDVPRERADPSLDYLTSRGLINMFGPDIAFLTDKGVQTMIEDLDIGSMDKQLKDFIQKPLEEQQQQAPRSTSKRVTPRPETAQLTHVDPDGQEFVLELGMICTVGRTDGNDIKVNDQRASKRHAEIRFENGTFSVFDLGSANGTLLNGEYIDSQRLKHDDELVIGRTMLLYQCPEIIPKPTKEVTGSSAKTPETAATLPPTERPAPADSVNVIPVIQGVPAEKSSPANPVAPSTLRPPSDNLFEAPSNAMFDEAPERSAPGDADLFADEGVGPTSDLFAGQGKQESKEPDLFNNADASTPSDDLFAQGGAKPPAEDLFADEAETAHGGADLFAADPKEVPEFFEPNAEIGVDFASIQPIEPIEALEELEPDEDSGVSVSPSEPLGEGRTITEPPLPIAPDNLLLENKPVVDAEEDAGEATVMVSRSEFLGENDPGASEDLPKWGNDQAKTEDPEAPVATEASVPAHDAEALPLATPSLVDLKAVTPEEIASAKVDSEFHRTLRTLRDHAEKADLPDREALLHALDLVEAHPYVRVAIRKIER